MGWKVASRSLQQIVANLAGEGYLCFLLLTVALVPLSKRWWHDEYESYSWRNIFCGLASDPDLFSVYLSYGSNHYSTSYALQNLLVLPSSSSNFSRLCKRSLRC